MSTLASGTSTQITLAAGQSLLVMPGGSGIAALSGGQQSGVSYRLGTSRVTIGPFTQAQLVSVSADRAVDYFVQPTQSLTAPPGEELTVGPDGTFSDARLNALVSGAGNGRLNGSVGGVPLYTARSGATKASTMWQQTLMLPDGADAVRIALLSDMADVSTYTGIKAAVQTTNAANLTAPVSGNLVACTFGGASSPTFSAGNVEDPVAIWSDWMPVVNRGPGVNYLIVRHWYPSAVAAGGGYFDASMSGGRYSALASLGVTGAAKVSSTSTDQTTNLAQSLSDTPFTLPLFVQAAYRRKMPVVWQFGDSTRQGFWGNGAVSALERWGISRNLAGRPVSAVNMGYTSQTTAQIIARLRRLVASGQRCDVLVWQIASPNDIPASVTSAQQIAFAAEALALAQQMGAAFVADGPYPITASAPNGTQSAMVAAARDWGQAVVSPGPLPVVYADYSALHQGGAFGQWVASYNYSGDGLHQNELATTAVILPALSAALAAVGLS